MRCFLVFKSADHIRMLSFNAASERRVIKLIPKNSALFKNSLIVAPTKISWSRSFSNKPDFHSALDEKYFKYSLVEKDIYSWWESKGYFQPSKVSETSKGKKFVLPMPPPNVTGYLHMGHAIFIALQDIMARFHRMKGYSTLWIPGT